MKYKDYNDSELICYINENNEEAIEIIYKKYEPLINNLASKIIKYYENIGLEKKDLIQEGMIGLTKAINSYKENMETIFYSFAKVCIERQMLSIVRTNKTQKNKILNESFSLENLGDKTNLIDKILSDNTKNPEILFDLAQSENKIFNIAKNKLTDFELLVFQLRINNFDYKEIAQILDKNTKSIDNALTRIRFKLKKELKVA